GEATPPRARTVGTRERAKAARIRDVHGETQPNLGAPDAGRLSPGAVEGVVHPRKRLEGLDHRPGKQVREGDLGQLRRRAILVDEPAVLVEKLDGDLALRRGGGNLEAWAHVSP